MTSSAPLASDGKTRLTALLVIGSILLFELEGLILDGNIRVNTDSEPYQLVWPSSDSKRTSTRRDSACGSVCGPSSPTISRMALGRSGMMHW